MQLVSQCDTTTTYHLKYLPYILFYNQNKQPSIIQQSSSGESQPTHFKLAFLWYDNLKLPLRIPN